MAAVQRLMRVCECRTQKAVVFHQRLPIQHLPNVMTNLPENVRFGNAGIDGNRWLKNLSSATESVADRIIVWYLLFIRPPHQMLRVPIVACLVFTYRLTNQELIMQDKRQKLILFHFPVPLLPVPTFQWHRIRPRSEREVCRHTVLKCQLWIWFLLLISTWFLSIDIIVEYESCSSTNFPLWN